MNNRSPIPLTSLLLLTTSACGGKSLVGNWDCVSLTYTAGGGDPCPLVYSEGGGETSTYAYGIDITSETAANFVAIHLYDYVGPDESYYLREIETYAADVSVEKNVWSIAAGNSIDFQCTASGSQMECTGDYYGDDVTMVFAEATIERTNFSEYR